MQVRTAKSDEGPVLSSVAREAKASWGYPPAWMDHWADELTISEDYIVRHDVLVAEENRHVAGFVALEHDNDHVELSHLWVRPARQGRGVGKALVLAAAAQAKERGCTSLRVVSDPHAVPFYRHMGARQVGWVDASFGQVDRRLPVLLLPARLGDGSRSTKEAL